jgi:predicted protein tyrosine phosphatase
MCGQPRRDPDLTRLTTILFVCGKNRRRSATAVEIFAGMAGSRSVSAGTSPDAECPVSADLLEWADQVFVMEQGQRRYLQAHFGAVLQDKKIVCLGVREVYSYMQPELVALLRTKMIPWLRRS